MLDWGSLDSRSFHRVAKVAPPLSEFSYEIEKVSTKWDVLVTFDWMVAKILPEIAIEDTKQTINTASNLLFREYNAYRRIWRIPCVVIRESKGLQYQ